ncbi:two-component sensor histidine kinase [Cytophagales bacterium WSM2-2]|nr:two-component sensor histidine kinase [Cytophagales bacterium WSM2-2]
MKRSTISSRDYLTFFATAKGSLFWRISGLFLLIFILLGISFDFITITLAKRYSDETMQKLNANVASHMLQHVKPFVNGSLDEKSLETIMRSMMAVNPSLEVYIISPDGTMLTSVVLHREVKPRTISTEPIKKFIKDKGNSLIYGDDPRNIGKSKIFSAAPVYENGVLLGYVYMVLAGSEFDSIALALQERYLEKIGLRSFAVTLGAAFLIGLFSLWLLMRSLRDIIDGVKKIGQGDLNARIRIQSEGELGRLSVTINQMAEMLLQNLDKLKEVDILRRDLIANISHDIRTPISIIHGYVETLIIKQKELSEEQRAEYLKTVITNTERLERLVADLFELSKLESKQITPKKEILYLLDLIQDLGAKYKLRANQKSITFEAECSIGNPTVHADVAMIDRVLQNLIDNAINYTPEFGKVRVFVSGDGEKAIIEVSNTGQGIPPDEIPKIFDRYYKVESLAGRGTGLGLAIVKNILDMHDTKIIVHSEPSKNTFSFTLPLVLK